MYVTDWSESIQMRYKIQISWDAELDLEAIGDYIAYELLNPKAAVDTLKGIRRTINSLKKHPGRYSFDDDEILRFYGVRRIIYRNYKIYYIVDNTVYKVYIVRILHHLTDNCNWLYRTLGISEGQK